MKKIIIVGVVVAVSILAIIFMRDRFDMGMFSRASKQGGDLEVVNDSSDTISVEYKEDGKEVSPVLKPGEKITGGKGFIRIFDAKKLGSYELTYSFPRPAAAPQQVTLSQVVESVKKEKFEDEIIVRKGMIGDIKVEYEEVRDLEVTY
jgi:hypothetical protein